MLSLLTNPTSMQALRAREETVRDLAEVRNRLSTGLRVAGPKDSASSYIISKSIKSQIAGWSAVLDSLVRGQSTVAVASEGVRGMSDVLIRTRERLLSLKSATDENDRALLRQDIRSLVAQSDLIARQSAYGEVNLLTAKLAPPPPPPQPADFLLPFPTSPASGEFTFTLDAGALAGDIFLELDLGVDPDKVEIYRGTKREAATGRSFNSGGPARLESGLQVLGFSYDPADGLGQTLSFRFNVGSTGPVDWSMTALRIVYPPPLSPPLSIITVLSTPQNDTIRIEQRALLSESLQLRELTTEPIDAALAKIEAAIATVNSAGAYFGGVESQLERQHAFGLKLQSNLAVQVGALVDADLGRESARLTALLTREQLANTSLNIASSSTRVLLDLFQPTGRVASRGFSAAA